MLNKININASLIAQTMSDDGQFLEKAYTRAFSDNNTEWKVYNYHINPKSRGQSSWEFEDKLRKSLGFDKVEHNLSIKIDNFTINYLPDAMDSDLNYVEIKNFSREQTLDEKLYYSILKNLGVLYVVNSKLNRVDINELSLSEKLFEEIWGKFVVKFNKLYDYAQSKIFKAIKLAEKNPLHFKDFEGAIDFIKKDFRNTTYRPFKLNEDIYGYYGNYKDTPYLKIIERKN